MDNLTILIPYHNNEDTLQRLLDSIGDVPTLIVDDASDNPLKDAAYRFDKNVGVSVARNKLLELADSEYVMFADADDAFNEGWAEYVESVISENPDADSIIFPYLTELKGGEIILESTRQDFRKPYCFGNVYKLDTLKSLDIHFLPELRYLEDNVFCDTLFRYTVIEQIKTVCVPNPIYTHLFNKASATNGHEEHISYEGMLQDTVKARAEYFKEILQSERPLFGNNFYTADLGCLYYVYLNSERVDLDESDLKDLVCSLKNGYGDILNIPEQMKMSRSSEAGESGLIILPSYTYEDFILRFTKEN